MKRIILILLSVCVFLMLSVSIPAANAGSAVLTWTAPTTNVDGTPLTDLAGFKVYWGNVSGNYSYNKDVGNVVTYSLTGLGKGTWFFAVTAYDTSGNASVYSNEVKKNITVNPSPPTGCSVQ